MIKIPLWKRALSHVFAIQLKSFESEKNGRMKLVLSKGAFCLTTSNAIYSYGKHYTSFGSVFQKLKMDRDIQVRNVLVLGWGLGSIAELLAESKSIETIVGVEHDPVLVELYRAEVMGEYSFDIQLFTGDALQWVHHQTEQRFDLICSDVFVDNETPEGILQPSFISALYKLLRPEGRILLSKLNLNPSDANENAALERLLEESHFNYEVINSIGNRIFMVSH